MANSSGRLSKRFQHLEGSVDGPMGIDRLTRAVERIEILSESKGRSPVSRRASRHDQRTSLKAELVWSPRTQWWIVRDNIAEYAAMSDKSVLVFNMEMPAEQIILRDFKFGAYRPNPPA